MVESGEWKVERVGGGGGGGEWSQTPPGVLAIRAAAVYQLGCWSAVALPHSQTLPRTSWESELAWGRAWIVNAAESSTRTFPAGGTRSCPGSRRHRRMSRRCHLLLRRQVGGVPSRGPDPEEPSAPMAATMGGVATGAQGGPLPGRPPL